MAHKHATPVNRLSVHKFWIGCFVIWLVLLTGIFERWFGSPGLRQYLQVESLLTDSRQQSTDLEFEIARLKEIQPQLETNAMAQEREIRKVLGFLGPGEVVFEF